MHIINKHGIYVTLTVPVTKLIDVTKLVDCQVFIDTQAYMNAVMQLHTDVCDEDEVSGSELTLWDDGLLENYCNEFTIDMSKLEEELSNFTCQ